MCRYEFLSICSLIENLMGVFWFSTYLLIILDVVSSDIDFENDTSDLSLGPKGQKSKGVFQTSRSITLSNIKSLWFVGYAI